MGRSCFHLDCVANKWKRNPSAHALPSFFRFPKCPSLFDKWKKAIPPRAGSKAREPSEKDYLCSLHFKLEDVEKYFEYKFVKGLPQSEIVRMERGIWSLKDDAVPFYFHNNNPDTNLLLREVKHKSTSPSLPEGSNQEEAIDSDPSETEGIHFNQAETIVSLVSTTESDSSEKSTMSRPPIDYDKDICRKVMLDHSYYTPLKVSEENTAPNPISNPSPNNDSFVIADPTPIENPSFITSPTSSNKAKSKLRYEYDPYTIEQLHQDVLDVILPKSWTFFQSDDDLNTVFMYNSCDGSVHKSVSFKGTCRPDVTINSTVMPYKRINSKKDIEELLELASIVNY